jgi:hypothetical protein
MVSTGGLDPTGMQGADEARKDPFTYGLGIFDMTTWQWRSGYDSKADPYMPSDQVKQYYRQKYISSQPVSLA